MGNQCVTLLYCDNQYIYKCTHVQGAFLSNQRSSVKNPCCVGLKLHRDMPNSLIGVPRNLVSLLLEFSIEGLISNEGHADPIKHE